ncbi:response regulator [bacterium]
MENKVILLVEDNPDDAALMLRTIKESEIQNQIVVAHDGAEALEYVFCQGDYKQREDCELPIFIILDIRLPKINGLEVLKQIRNDERTKLLPVVMLTSSDEECDLIESYTLGANSYVRKPVNFIQFQNVVEQLIKYWLTWNEVPSLPIGS